MASKTREIIATAFEEEATNFYTLSDFSMGDNISYHDLYRIFWNVADRIRKGKDYEETN